MHRWTDLFIPTLRQAPADADRPSHRLLGRAGYVRPLAAGIYSYLFLGQRSMNKISQIVREEMDNRNCTCLLSIGANFGRRRRAGRPSTIFSSWRIVMARVCVSP